MSKLQELIKELCPDGVEFRKLWNVTIWDKKFNSVDRCKQPKVISYPYLLAKELFLLEQCNGNVFLLSTGEQTGWTTEELAGDYLCEGEVVTIPWGKSRKVSEVMKYYKGKFVTADNRIATSNDTSILSNKYLYYWLLTQSDNIAKCYRGAGIQHPDMSKILDLEIPLPPLEVQNEIVRILDTFTSQVEELQAELEARKEQYEYYRNKLLTFAKIGGGKQEVAWMKLGEIGNVYSGKNKEKNPIGTYPVYGSTGIIAYTENYSYCDERILIARVGANAGYTHMAFGKYDVSDNTLIVDLKEGVNLKYVYYTLVNLNLNKYAKGGGQPLITAGEIKIIQIPIPPLSEQQRIVSILDKFEFLVNDLTTGLPAEIAAVQEQYEYYRNKLLTFKRIS